MIHQLGHLQKSSNNDEVTQSTPVVNLETQPSSERSRPQLSSSWIKPQLSSSNLSFVSFVDNQPEDPDYHTGYVPEKSLCPSAYVVQPSINFSRSRQPSITKSAPSVIDMPRNPDRNTRIRRRLSKRFPVKGVVKVTAVPEIPERPRRKSRPWKLDWSRSTSPEESLEECSKTNHTPEPSQDIEAAKPPFLKELSSFLSSKAGKWILPKSSGPKQIAEVRQQYRNPFSVLSAGTILSLETFARDARVGSMFREAGCSSCLIMWAVAESSRMLSRDPHTRELIDRVSVFCILRVCCFRSLYEILPHDDDANNLLSQCAFQLSSNHDFNLLKCFSPFYLPTKLQLQYST